jgi:NAD+ synthase
VSLAINTMNNQTVFSADILKLDAAMAVDRIVQAIRSLVLKDLRRKGAVLGLSGGIDSSVVAALSVRALGADRVLGLLMPERDSAAESLPLGQVIGDHLGIKTIVEDITPLLDGAGCYRRRDEMIRRVIPLYTSDYKCKIVLPGFLQ